MAVEMKPKTSTSAEGGLQCVNNLDIRFSRNIHVKRRQKQNNENAFIFVNVYIV